MQQAYASQYRTLWERHWWWRSREAQVLAYVRSIRQGKPSNARILDVGCGDGLFFESLSRFGDVEGIEPDSSLVNDPRWRDRIKVARIEENPEILPSNTYDLILMLDVLEHLADDLGALKALRGSLRPEGRIVLTVPALSWLWSGHDVANEHHRRYSRRTLRRALEASGFRVETLRYFFMWTIAPMLARRLFDPAGKRKAGDHTVSIPPEPLNRILTIASQAEHAAGRVIPWPIGSSLLAVASSDGQ